MKRIFVIFLCIFFIGGRAAVADTTGGAAGAAAGAALTEDGLVGMVWRSLPRIGKGAVTVIGLVGGPFLVYENTKGVKKHSVGNVLGGIGGGAAAGFAVGSIVPVIGNTVGTIVGAVVGGLVSGSQLFSETDCLYDPVTGKFTCCHTAFNKGERHVDIGGYMFCNATNDAGEELQTDDGKLVAIKGSVRQCQVGGRENKGKWWDDLWDDDAWSAECIVRLCPSETKPAPAINAVGVNWIEDKNNFCWNWECDTGYKLSNNKCVNPDGSDPVNNYDAAINKIKLLQQDLINKCGNIF